MRAGIGAVSGLCSLVSYLCSHVLFFCFLILASCLISGALVSVSSLILAKALGKSVPIPAISSELQGVLTEHCSWDLEKGSRCTGERAGFVHPPPCFPIPYHCCLQALWRSYKPYIIQNIAAVRHAHTHLLTMRPTQLSLLPRAFLVEATLLLSLCLGS